MKRTLFAGAIALTVVSPAFAADLPAAAPPPQAPATYVPVAPPVYNWGGIYIGANAGGSWFSQSNSTFTWSLGGTSSGQSFNDSGFAAGGQLGANFQSGQFVFGIEGDADYLSNKASVSTATDFSGLAGSSNTHTYTLDFLSTVRGRLGFAWDRALIYGTGGLAMADYQIQRTQTGTGGLAPAGNSQTVSDFRLGWAAGAGVEYAFSDMVTARVEYLVAGLESVSNTYNFAAFGNGTVTQSSPTAYVNIVRGGLNFKFGGF